MGASERFRCVSLPAVRVVTFLARQERPADAGVLVGDGHKGLAVTEALTQSDNPVLEVRALIGRSGEGGI